VVDGISSFVSGCYCVVGFCMRCFVVLVFWWFCYCYTLVYAGFVVLYFGFWFNVICLVGYDDCLLFVLLSVFCGCCSIWFVVWIWFVVFVLMLVCFV